MLDIITNIIFESHYTFLGCSILRPAPGHRHELEDAGTELPLPRQEVRRPRGRELHATGRFATGAELPHPGLRRAVFVGHEERDDHED